MALGKRAADGIVRGALILTVAGFLVKIIGMIYKIPLTNRLGDDGMGYFNTAYTVYTFFFVLSSSGLPTALALSVAKDLGEGNEDAAYARFLGIRRFCTLLGISLSALLLLTAKLLSGLFGSRGAYLSLLAISPALWFVTAASVYRGYRQGRGDMLPSAISQTVEALGKLTFGLLFLTLAGYYGFTKDKMAAYAILGLSVAAFLAYLFLALFCREERRASRNFTEDVGGLTLDTLKTAMPITLSSVAATLVTTLDLVLLMRALVGAGYTYDAANAAWGNYSALVLPLFHMPQILITPIAAAALPVLRQKLAKGDTEGASRLAGGALLITAFVSALSALGLSLFSRDALLLIYTDPQSVARAYPKLALVAIAVFPFGITTVSAAFLQAKGRLWLPTVSLFIGAAVKLFATLFLVNTFGESVSAIGTLLSYTVSAAINFAALAKSTRLTLSRILLLPFAVSTLSVGAGVLAKRYFDAVFTSSRVATLLAIGFSGILALGLLLLSGVGRSEGIREIFKKDSTSVT